LVNGDASIEVLMDVIENFELTSKRLIIPPSRIVLEYIEKIPEIGDFLILKIIILSSLILTTTVLIKVLITKKEE
jgi:hypothetical protein